MKNLNDQFAACVRALLRRMGWPYDAKTASVRVESVDGEEFEIPVHLGKSSQTQNTRDRQADLAKNKKRILDAAPEKDQPPISKTKLFSKAGLTVTNWNNDRLWELVEDGELVHLKLGFRKAK